MAGSTFYGSTNNQYIKPKIVWSSTTNIDGNYSTVTATLYVSRTNSGYTTSGTWSGGLTISGSTATTSKSVNITQDSNTMLISHTVNIGHNSDGSQTVTISAYGGIPGTSYTSTSISGQFNLDTIPRASSFSMSSTNFIIGNPITLTINRASGAFSHVVYMEFGDLITIGTGVGGSFTWNTGNNESTFYKYIPNENYGFGMVHVETYNGSTYIGRSSVRFQANVPSSVVPVINSVTLAPSTIVINGKNAGYVQNKSTLGVNISASGAKGSSIRSYMSTLNGITYTGASFTTGVLTVVDTNTLTTTVTDTRGRTVSRTTQFTVAPYTNPVINSFSVQRCTQAGVLNDEGTFVKVIATGNISDINKTNTKGCKLKYRTRGTTTWTEVAIALSDYSLNYSQTVGNNNFSINNSYDFQLDLSDYFTTTSMVTAIGTATPTMDFKAGGKGIAFGKVAETDNAIETAYPIIHSGNLNKGGWGTPTKGAITQVIDSSGSQHSVMVGVDSNNKRCYGIDLYDSPTNPIMRLYAGSRYIDIKGSGTHAVDGDWTATGKVQGNSLYVGSSPVIERGSNSNGEYIKFYDGTMICTSYWYVGSNEDFTNNIYGAVYGVRSYYRDFPATFISTPNISGGTSTNTTLVICPRAETASKYYYTCWTNLPISGVILYCSITAIGRWK